MNVPSQRRAPRKVFKIQESRESPVEEFGLEGSSKKDFELEGSSKKDFELEGSDVCECSGQEVNQVLQPCLRPLRVALRAVGIVPYVYDEASCTYRSVCTSWAMIHTVITAVYLSVLLVTTVVGLTAMFTRQSDPNVTQDKNVQAIKLTGVILVSECLVNAWTQVINVLYYGRRACGLLNDWNTLVAGTDLNPVQGVRSSVLLQVIFLAFFWCALLTLTLLDYPKIIGHVLDGVAQGMLMVPPAWSTQHPALAMVLRVLTCVVCLHIFCVFKGSLFSFTTNCHLLKNGLGAWNTQLRNILEDIWQRRDRTRGRLGLLVQSHYQLVRLVRETEYIFGPMLQCYYGSTVIILCTELYLLAYRIGSSQYSADGVIATSLMTLQTAAVFVQVSLSAAAVQEVADDSIDVLRRGLPYDTSDRDKFNKDELTTALTGSPLYITGGKFFVINRPFIITVLSAVVTYFIVMIQFMQPSQSEQQDASNYTLSLNITDVSQLNFTDFSQFNLTDVN